MPDEITIALIRERLAEADARRGFVLDGFPRNEAQAEALDAMLAEIGRRLDAILFFDLPDDIATERMLARAAVENRADDAPEVIARRLATYHTETEPIVEHYRLSGRLVPAARRAYDRRGLRRDPRRPRRRSRMMPRDRPQDRCTRSS